MEIKPFVVFLEDFQYMLIEEIDFDYNLLPIHVKGQLFEINVDTGKVEELGEHEAQFSITLDAIWDREE
ncbi:hypothetical protein [Halocella sp. SP3-1]|uniref:hypothetical protein n=1 Tax=Halocella sp. SP3-1 TaxID=2382161 RepID=UPI000F752CA9|nr:hypothetical protein [Halocella sp. SP3-1]AZO96165.1 hypothetical protein D7D81_17065 [Halocella sp. SP3-1]